MSYSPEEPSPSSLFFLAAFGLQWFSWFDMMDGQRAKRLKCGTPIGRIIDEAGDAIQYTWGMILLGYGLRLPPGWLHLSTSFVNMSMFAIEMKYIFTGKLELTSGATEDIGPVEMELIFTIFYFFLGIFGV